MYIVIIMTKQLDRILEQLQDDKWHTIDEIKKVIPCLASDALLQFLQEQAFIDIKNEKLKITGLGLRFLDI
ncbi:Uncharacterised protein [uncultured archaeon]|nr:Uncharacterised protein [uncultured archaeon]